MKGYLFTYPSAGIGRQGKFKLFWQYVVNVQAVPWIHKKNR